MTVFPRTQVGDLSLSRMVIGTNWFLGHSHCTPARNTLIARVAGSRASMADIIQVFFSVGIDTIIGDICNENLAGAIRDAEDRTGVRGIIVSTPSLPVTLETCVNGFDPDETARILDRHARLGTALCMPHTSTTDVMVDRCAREVRKMDAVCAMIRERGMVPGLSTHLPETIVYADETGLDVETYICIYNAMGFLMPLEVDWTARIIQEARKPVLTIKPMAAGQIRPFQGLTFVWNTIRQRDMVAVGTMSPDEAKELIDMSLAILSRRAAEPDLQETRSKASVKRA